MSKDAFVYDRTLRELFQDIPRGLVKLISGKEAKELLETRFPQVEEKEADLVVKLEDDSILHIEIQTNNDNNMPKRMLQYSLLIEKVHKNFPSQVVVYIGDSDSKIKNSLKTKHISYRYDLINLKDIDCSYLLNSEDINDNILAILCNVKDIEKLIFKLNQKLMNLNNKKREDYLRKIFYLLRLRPTLYEKIYISNKKELKMPFVIEKTRDPLYKEGMTIGIDKGIEKGIEKGVLLVAKRMIKAKIDLETISKVTNLPIEKLEDLKKDK